MLPNLEVVQGDDRDFDFQVYDALNAKEDITGWAFWFTVKSLISGADDPELFKLTNAAGILLDVPKEGLGRIRISAVNTVSQPPDRYAYFFQCRKGTAAIETLSRGFLTIFPQATRA